MHSCSHDYVNLYDETVLYIFTIQLVIFEG